MNFEYELEREHSKMKAEEIVNYVLHQPNSFSELFSLLFHKDIRIVQRAAWPLGMIGTKQPEWFLPYFDQMIDFIEKPPHDAVIRNLYRIIQDLPIPEDYHGTLYELCMRDLTDGKMPVAIKVFAMTVAFNISKVYPELQQELKLTIQENSLNQSPGYHSRARKILPKLA